MKSKIKNSVRNFCREYRVRNLDTHKLKSIIKSQGYRIIRFGKVYNDENTEALIKCLDLNEYIVSSCAFTYADDEYRLVFLEKNLSEKEELILLTHEEGHIYNKHFGEYVIVGKNILQEYEANEFCHYVLNSTFFDKLTDHIWTHKAISACLASIIVVVISLCITLPLIIAGQTYDTEYYAVPTGLKFHKEDCFYIKDKSSKQRISKDEIDARRLSPCKACLPELQENK